MKVSFINVGYGDSIMIEHKLLGGNYNILVDGGQPGGEHYEEFPQRMTTIDFLKERAIDKIDLLIVTHLHEDHVGGLLEVVRNVEVEEMWTGYVLPKDYAGKMIKEAEGYCEAAAKMAKTLNIYNEISFILRDRGKKIVEIDSTELSKEITGSLYADVFFPGNAILQKLKNSIFDIYTQNDAAIVESTLVELSDYVNNTSIVIRLDYKNRKVLLTGDVYNTYWSDNIENKTSIQCDILKLPHHGHVDGMSIELIEAVRPDYIVVSTSNNRPDNCPNPLIIELLDEYFSLYGKRVKLLFTDAVHMPPYSTHESRHRAVIFDLDYSEDGKISTC